MGEQVAEVTCTLDEPVRRNVSRVHEELQSRCLRWAAARSTGRGIRGSIEITLSQGYIADAVCLGSFQNQHFQRYCEASKQEPEVWRSVNGVMRRHGRMPAYWLMVFEVKVSRADFLSTFGKSGSGRIPCGSVNWIVTPANLVKPAELPTGWGLLEASGRGLREKVMPRAYVRNMPDLDAAAREILWHGDVGLTQAIRTCPNCGETANAT